MNSDGLARPMTSTHKNNQLQNENVFFYCLLLININHLPNMDEDRHNMADMTFAEHVNFSQTTSIIITHKHTHIYTRLNNTHICQTHFKMTREEGGGTFNKGRGRGLT